MIFFSLLFSAYVSITSLPRYSKLTLALIVFASENVWLVCGGVVVLATILLALSYMISVKLYSKRDF